MNRISSGQMTVSLFLPAAFMLMCSTFSFGEEALLGAVIAAVAALLLCIPMFLLYKNDFSLSSYCAQRHFVVPLLYVAYFIVRGGISFLLLWKGAENLSLPFSQPLMTAIMIGIVCLYTASLGLRTFARTSTFVFGFFVLTMCILLLGAWQRMDFGRLYPAADSTVLGSSLHILSLLDTLPALFVLMSFTRKQKRTGGALRFLLLTLVLWEFILLLCMTVLGSLLGTAESPFFLLTSVSQPLSTQRADAFYLIVFVMLCVIRLTLLTVLSAHLLGMLFPKLRCRSILSLFGMIGAALGLSAIGFSGNLFCIIGIVLFACAVPLIFYMRLRRHPQWRESSQQEEQSC